MTRRYVNMFSEDLKQGFETYNPLDKIKKQVSRTQHVKRNDIKEKRSVSSCHPAVLLTVKYPCDILNTGSQIAKSHNQQSETIS